MRLLHAVCITPSNAPLRHSRHSLHGGQLLLTHYSGALPGVLKEIGGLADEIVLDTRCLPRDPSTTGRALARCCRLGTRLQITGPMVLHPNLENALKPAGFVAQAGAVAGNTWVYAPHWQQRSAVAPDAAGKHSQGCAMVVGAGLAGAAVAASLARRGWRVCVLDAQAPASGASGVPVGLLVPHTSKDHSVLSRISAAGLAATWAQVRGLLKQGPDWQQNGVQQCAPVALAASGSGPHAHATAQWHASGGWVKPARLVHAWLAQPGIAVQSGCPVARLAPPDAEHAQWRALDDAGDELARASLMVLAAGFASQALLSDLALNGTASTALPGLPRMPLLQAIRGQVTWGSYSATGALLPLLPATPQNGHGSLIAGVPADTSCEGVAGDAKATELRWFCGATYQRDAQNLAPRLADQQANLARLPVLLPATGAALATAVADTALHAWVGIRCASRDRLPVVGPVPGWSCLQSGEATGQTNAPGLWLCTALGSRGLSYAALCAELLAARLHQEPLPLPASLARHLFIERRSRY